LTAKGLKNKNRVRELRARWPRLSFPPPYPGLDAQTMSLFRLITAARPPMTDSPYALAAASPDDLADALAFALWFQGRKWTHKADEIVARNRRSPPC
jgi:hypothetical protein